MNDSDSTTESSGIAPGSVIGERYKIVKLLGAGGMGSVYLANDLVLGGDIVALKVLESDSDHDKDSAQRFLQEVQLMRRVNHPNVVRTYDVGISGALIYYSMEYVSGASLEAVLQSGGIPMEQVASFIIQLAEGLEAIHREDVIHRDLKPANILLLENGSIKIADFGIAKTKSSKLTKRKIVLGSIDHIPPEAWLGKDLSHRADFYSLGIILYEVTTGALPFVEDQPAAVMWRHVHETPVAPRDQNPSIPEWLNELILRLLAKDPDDRPASAAEIAQYVFDNTDLGLSRPRVTSNPTARISLGEEDVTQDFEEEEISQSLRQRAIPERRPRHEKSPLSIVLLPDTSVLVEARVKAAERNFPVKEVANLIMQDPPLTIEFLKTANAIFYAGSAAIHSPEKAIVRLGVNRTIQILNALNNIQRFEDDEVSSAFEGARINCRRVSIVSMIIADSMRPELTTVARVAGLFCHVGLLLACTLYEKRYVEIAKAHKGKTFGYRLNQHLQFDSRTQMLTYLERQGIPPLLLAPYVEELKSPDPNQVALRMIVSAAQELVGAFDSGTWKSYDPSVDLPPRSSLRLLGITAHQHQLIFQICKSYLKGVEEEVEDRNLIIFRNNDGRPEASEPARSIEWTSKLKKPTEIAVSPSHLHALTRTAQSTLQNVYDLCSHADTLEELADDLLVEITTDGKGPYLRGALLELSEDQASAKVLAAIGQGFEPGQVFTIEDDLSPLKLCNTKIRSFNTGADPKAPFGVGAYALGPISGDEDCPLILYVDCGEAKHLSFESRRVFRHLIQLISSTLG